jgi:hypothetical protein
MWSNELPHGSMYYDRIIGNSATQVTVLGTLELRPDASNGGDKVVPVRLEWQDDGYGYIEIKLIEAGAHIGELGSGLPPGGI